MPQGTYHRAQESVAEPRSLPCCWQGSHSLILNLVTSKAGSIPVSLLLELAEGQMLDLPSLAVCPWASYLTSLSPSAFICKVWITSLQRLL